MSLIRHVSIIAGLTAALAAPLFGSTGETYGYGSRASALGNTMMGAADDSFATFYNPAINSTVPGLRLSVGTAYAHPSFLGVEGVVVRNSAVSSAQSDVTGKADTGDYLDHIGQIVGASYNLGEKWKNLALGLTASLPVTRLAYLDTGEPFKPEYFGFRSRTQRPQIYASLGASPFSRLHFATGIAFATNMSANADLDTSGGNGTVSHARFSTSIKPGAAPYFALFWNPEPYRAGLTVRMPNKYHINLDSAANARLFSATAEIPLAFNSQAALFYDPLEVDLGASWRFDERWWLTAEVDWYQYKAFESPTLSVTDTGSAFALKNSISNLPTMRNILVPRVGVERAFETLTARLGYFFRPSPVVDNSGPGNLVDPPRHVATVGLGIDLKKAKFTETRLVLDLHAQYHHLVTQRVTKSPNNEAGTSGQSKVGSPGFDAGGRIYGGGLSLSMLF